jgi:hypothetical protein
VQHCTARVEYESKGQCEITTRFIELAYVLRRFSEQLRNLKVFAQWDFDLNLEEATQHALDAEAQRYAHDSEATHPSDAFEDDADIEYGCHLSDAEDLMQLDDHDCYRAEAVRCQPPSEELIPPPIAIDPAIFDVFQHDHALASQIQPQVDSGPPTLDYDAIMATAFEGDLTADDSDSAASAVEEGDVFESRNVIFSGE